MRWSQGLPQRELIYETLFQTREMRRRTEAESENFRRDSSNRKDPGGDRKNLEGRIRV